MIGCFVMWILVQMLNRSTSLALLSISLLWVVHFSFVSYSKICFVELVGISQFRNCNKHNSRLAMVLIVLCNFRTHRNIDRHLWAFLLLLGDHSWDKLLLILILFPFFYFLSVSFILSYYYGKCKW